MEDGVGGDNNNNNNNDNDQTVGRKRKLTEILEKNRSFEEQMFTQ